MYLFQGRVEAYKPKKWASQLRCESNEYVNSVDSFQVTVCGAIIGTYPGMHFIAVL